MVRPSLDASAGQGRSAISRRTFLGSSVIAGASVLCGAGPKADCGQSPPGDSIDAHAHVWSADTLRYPLKPGVDKRDMELPHFTPEELWAHARPCGINRIVLIQMSYYGDDNRYMLEALAKYRGTMVGLARIDGEPHPRQAMLRLARQGVRGLRIVGVDRPADRWLEGPRMAEIWKTAADENLVLGGLVDPGCLDGLEAMCRKYPATPLVIDHLARIGYDGTIRAAALEKLCRLSAHEKVCVKLSAFYALGRRKAPYLDLAPMIRRVVGAFGPQRLLWASDSPFQVVPPHSYADSIALVRNGLDFLTAADLAWLLRKTAERLFFS
jgi:predicted TIM-barrel fold metal-dependent hydrolase